MKGPSVRFFRDAAALTLAVFVACGVVEHVLVTRLSPATHQISEYANDRHFGWVMTIGFFSWAVSLLLTAAVTARRSLTSQISPTAPESRHGRRGADVIVTGLVAIAGVGMLITGCFHTQTVAGVLPPGIHLTAGGRLHDIGSGLATLAIALAVATSWWMAGRRGWFAVVSALALVLATVSDAALLAVGPSVGGIRERILVVIGCVWQACLLRSGSDEDDRRRRPAT